MISIFSMFIRIFLLIFFLSHNLQAKEYKILAIIGDEIITNYDLEQRIKVISLTSGRSFSGQNLFALKNQLLDVLVTEKIYLTEARKSNLLPSATQIKNSYTKMIEQSNLSVIPFENNLAALDIDTDSIKEQIKAELAWQNIIIGKIKAKVKINDFEIEDYLSEENNLGEYEYLLKILEFPIKENVSIYELEQIMNKIHQDVAKNTNNFDEVIKDFSASDVNLKQPIWKKLNELDEEIRQYIPLLKKGELSKPVKAEDKYYLVLLEDVRKNVVKVDNTKARDEIYRKLFLKKLEAAAESYIDNAKRSTFTEYKINGSI